MNQWANIFLSFYLLLLACMPCHDTNESVDTIAQTIVQSTTDSQANHGEDTDLCSPLCCCACCGSLMISPYAEQAAIHKAVSAKTLFPIETKHTAGFVSLLWQPPQSV